MRRSWTLALVAVGLTLVTACAGQKTEAPHGGQFMSQIEQASAMGFSGDRAATLTRLAGERLTQSEQLALVDVVQTSQMFSRDKRTVLDALIANPVTTGQSREYIRSRVLNMAMVPEDSDAVIAALAAAPR